MLRPHIALALVLAASGCQEAQPRTATTTAPQEANVSIRVAGFVQAEGIT